MVKIPASKGEGVTLMGVLSWGMAKTMIFKHKKVDRKKRDPNHTNLNGTCGENVLAFFQFLHREIGLRSKCIIMDNHPSHWRHLVRDYLEKVGCYVLYTPKASSWCNPIETLWALVKKRWAAALLAQPHNQATQAWMVETLEQICDSVTE